MTKTRLVSDLRDNYEEILNAVRETSEPIVLDGDKGGDIILMNRESFEDKLYNYKISCELYEAEREYEENGILLSREEVMEELRKIDEES